MDFPKSVPNVGLVDGRFVDENNVTGQVGSLITADWGNAMTSEIINVIEAAELVPTEGQNDQLVGAIEKLVMDGSPQAATEETAGIARVATDADFNTAVPDDTKLVTVRKIKNWFYNASNQATESIAGFSKVANQALTDAGADDATFVTPKKLRRGVSYTIAANGYIAFPSWLGGLIIQWGTVSIPTYTSYTQFSRPLVVNFPSECFGVVATSMNSTSILSVLSKTTSTFVLSAATRESGSNSAASAAFFISVGV